MKQTRFTPLVLLATLAACRPEFDDDLALIESPRVLAVQSSVAIPSVDAEVRPAQAKPSETEAEEITWRALVVDRTGTLAEDAALDWALCLARKPLTELGPVSPACLVRESPDLVPLGSGTTVRGAVPSNACSLFGPQLPETGRPVDPDLTGGFYQPLRLLLPLESDSYALGQTRLVCTLSGVTQAQSREFVQRDRRNYNPALSRTVARGAAGSTDLSSAEPLIVAPGEQLNLDAEWPFCELDDVCGDGLCGIDETRTSCPEECTDPLPPGCAGAERYVAFDQESRTIVSRREAITISWYANAGKYANERTGTAESDTANLSSNVWTAPGSNAATLWVVIRDSRGGVGFQEYRIQVGGP
jgi:hypothetical protein